jgi:NADH dehydrogenase FAD-containing subunit
MGNKTSAISSVMKHVIIVGGSYAGIEVAVKLWDHLKVTIIDTNDYMEHVVYGYKSFVEPNISQRSLSPMTNLGVNYHDKMTFK